MIILRSVSGGESIRFSTPSTCTPLPTKPQAFSLSSSPSSPEIRRLHIPTSCPSTNYSFDPFLLTLLLSAVPQSLQLPQTPSSPVKVFPSHQLLLQTHSHFPLSHLSPSQLSSTDLQPNFLLTFPHTPTPSSNKSGITLHPTWLICMRNININDRNIFCCN